MTASLPGLLNTYLAPLLLAVPVVVLLLLLGMRRGNPDEAPPRRRQHRARPPSRSANAAARLPAAVGATDAIVSAAPARAERRLPGPAPTLVPEAVPVADAGPPPTGAAAPERPPAVLVVDDSAVVRLRLRRLLEGAGHRVVLANDGLQALEALTTDRFALLLTDLEMPLMDGFELIAAVQGQLDTEQLPIIAITGHDELQGRVHDCQGLYGLFKKPWNDRQLLDRVAALVALGRRSRPLPQPA